MTNEAEIRSVLIPCSSVIISNVCVSSPCDGTSGQKARVTEVTPRCLLAAIIRGLFHKQLLKYLQPNHSYEYENHWTALDTVVLSLI